MVASTATRNLNCVIRYCMKIRLCDAHACSIKALLACEIIPASQCSFQNPLCVMQVAALCEFLYCFKARHLCNI